MPNAASGSTPTAVPPPKPSTSRASAGCAAGASSRTPSPPRRPSTLRGAGRPRRASTAKCTSLHVPGSAATAVAHAATAAAAPRPWRRNSMPAIGKQERRLGFSPKGAYHTGKVYIIVWIRAAAVRTRAVTQEQHAFHK